MTAAVSTCASVQRLSKSARFVRPLIPTSDQSVFRPISTSLTDSGFERAIGILRIVAASGSEGERLVEQNDATKLYLLGPEAYVLGTIASARYGIHTLALPALRRLADVSQDTAFLSILRGYEVVCIQREEGAY